MQQEPEFLDIYEPYLSSNEVTTKYSKNLTGKICRFCGESDLNVTFNTVPHIIPELFGRNNVTSNEECDTCNQKFQRFETDTSVLVQHYLTMLNIKTKNGVPQFQSSKLPGEYPTTFKIEDGQRILYFDRNLHDFIKDDDKKTLTIFFRTKKFRPYSVYKTFLKMALSILPTDDLKANPHFVEFLNSDEPIRNCMQVYTAFRYVLKTKYFPKPGVSLYKAKKILSDGTQYPEYLAVFFFGNVTWQMFLPISTVNREKHIKGQSLCYNYFPTFALEDPDYLQYLSNKYKNRGTNPKDIEPLEFHNLNLSITQKITITDKIVLHYGS